MTGEDRDALEKFLTGEENNGFFLRDENILILVKARRKIDQLIEKEVM